MTGLSIARPATLERASAFLTDGKYSLPLLKAGGIDVLDHMKEGLLEPDLLVDIKPLGRGRGGGAIGWGEGDGGGRVIRIEAGATLAEIAASDLLGEHASVLRQSAESAATPQIRNVATAGGNLMQRPRCWYYRNREFDCLKKGGARCFAIEGENKYHAVFGEGPCHIVHPSNIAPALVVCGGRIHVKGSDRDSLSIEELYHMPDAGLRDEANLREGEIITAMTCAPSVHSGFYSIREKQSFDWPLVFAAVSLELDGARIESARVCAGAVAPVPWRLAEVEGALRGVSLDDEDGLRKACAAATHGAVPMSENSYKLRLLPVAVRRSVLRAGGRKVEDLT